jgi:membrane associated rhomboid family serine protease
MENLRFRVHQVYQRYLMTIVLIILLVAWYELQVVTALLFDFGVTEVRHWFKFSISDGIKPGWMLAGISHRFPPHYGHLGRNVLFLAVFGGAVGRHISRRQYLLFFFGVGLESLFGEAV